jgi:hypothetical protein
MALGSQGMNSCSWRKEAQQLIERPIGPDVFNKETGIYSVYRIDFSMEVFLASLYYVMQKETGTGHWPISRWRQKKGQPFWLAFLLVPMKNQKVLHVEVPHTQRIRLDEVPPRFHFVAHQRGENLIG